MRKKFVMGAAVLALLMNAPQVSADDDIVVFGGEFEDEATPPKKVEKPKPIKETPPSPPPVVEKPKPESVLPPPQDKPDDLKPKPQPIEQPDDLKREQPTQPIERPDDLKQEQPTRPIEQPDDLTQEPPTKPIEKPDDLTRESPTIEIERPFEQPSNISGDRERVEEPIATVPPSNERTIEREPVRPSAKPQQKLKMLKPRFIKLAVDDTYTYYLDKKSVQWRKMPYMASEYMADVWIRMVERKPATLDEDMAYYGAENFKTEIEFAREQGYQYTPEDVQVLSSQAYILEHYYLRPKTNQIQFLCELEVFGRPQNTINERAYDYKNWENLVPGSVESVIYEATLKTIGKSKASERGHMTFFDMLDEYARIALN